MRLLLIGLNFAPELVGVGKYSGEMASWLAARGHDVTVVTAHPYYPEWPARPRERWRWRSETWEGCRVIRCPLYVPRRWSGLRRMLHLASFALSSAPVVAWQAVRGRAEIVAAIAPTLLSAPAALAAARLAGAKTWLHIQDFEIEAGFELRLLASRRVVEVALALERFLLRRFDLVSTISRRMAEAAERKGAAADRLMLFPNWVDTSLIHPLPGPVPLRRELGIADDRCVVLYSGNMGRKQGLEHAVEAARLLAASSEPSPLFVFAGAGATRVALEQAAAGLPNVRFLPLQPGERFNEFLNLGDIHLLPQRPGVEDLVMPSKLCGMLAAGRPVIATVPRESQIAAMLGAAGVLVAPDDAAGLAGAIRALAADPARRCAMGAAAREVACRLLESGRVLRAAERRLEALAGIAPCARPAAS